MKKLNLITTAIILIFLSLTSSAQVSTSIPKEAHLLQKPFKPMNILLIPQNVEGIIAKQGDLVMAFDGPTCVGAAIVEDVKKVLNLVGTSTDEVNEGYRPGSVIRLEYHSAHDNTVYNLIPQEILLGSMNYEELGTLYAEYKANALNIEERTDKAEIKVYPNPVSQQLHVLLENGIINNSEMVQLRLVGMSGNIVFRNEYPSNQAVITIDVGDLVTGNYTLEIQKGNTNYVQKMIKK